jgi:hypothetical protein
MRNPVALVNYRQMKGAKPSRIIAVNAGDTRIGKHRFFGFRPRQPPTPRA